MRSQLEPLSAEQLTAFERHFHHFSVKAYSWELWGAAYLMNGGCSDDCFHYFRSWLISRGRSVYEAALRDADSLAGVGSAAEFETFGYVAAELYERKTGGSFPASLVQQEPVPDLGPGWDFDDPEVMRRRYPELARRFLPE